MKVYKEKSKIDDPLFLTFWVVFQGDITRDPKRIRESTFWFDKFVDNYFFWRPLMTDDDLIEFFNKKNKIPPRLTDDSNKSLFE